MNTEQLNEEIEATDGKISPELAARLLEHEEAMLNGDTAVKPAETSSEPATATPEDTQKPEVQPADTAQAPAVKDEDLNADNTVLLAKDGKHTIPFERLVESRTQAQEWREKHDLLHAQYQALQATQTPASEQGEQNRATAKAVIEASGNNEDVIKLFGDFSEKEMVNAIKTIVSMDVSEKVQDALKSVLGPIEQQQQLSKQDQHFNAISQAHPDWQSVVESNEFDHWINGQPSFVVSAIQQVLNQGTPEQVNEVLSNYKTANNLNVNTAVPPAEAVKTVAQQAVAKAQSQIPHSLSDLPAGSPASVSREERMSQLSPMQLLEEMSTWSQDQIDAYTDRHA